MCVYKGHGSDLAHKITVQIVLYFHLKRNELLLVLINKIYLHRDMCNSKGLQSVLNHPCNKVSVFVQGGANMKKSVQLMIPASNQPNLMLVAQPRDSQPDALLTIVKVRPPHDEQT